MFNLLNLFYSYAGKYPFNYSTNVNLAVLFNESIFKNNKSFKNADISNYNGLINNRITSGINDKSLFLNLF